MPYQLKEVVNVNSKNQGWPMQVMQHDNSLFQHRGPTQSVCVADCYFIVNVLDLPFASPIAIYR